MLQQSDFSNFTFEQTLKINEVDGTGYVLRHNKTKARVLLIENKDKNKVFHIGFRTPPCDDTGVAHILEHSVLCGSKKFPSKDPFVELAKGSLNTFLNAMTYSDKTVYPIASCNDKDYHNLMHVYLDAVFYPNIYKCEEIFKQEGWHYELADADSPLKFNGVVYNEMKGVYSSPEDVLARRIEGSLLKDTPYAYESGGDPDAIPALTREEFLMFHTRYYHPSNSYIYLYGDVDFKKELDFIDREYLSKFDYLDIDSTVAMQAPYEKPVTVNDTYSVSEEEDDEDNVYLSYNFVTGTSADYETVIALQILEYVLFNMPGAPVKKRLIDRKIGKDLECSFDDGIQQPVFSIVVKNAKPGDEQPFIDTVDEVLREQAEKGINKKAILSAINSFEFKYRESSYGRFPKGLLYGLNLLNTWLYRDEDALVLADSLTPLKNLKEKVDTDYFEKLVLELMLNNNHKSYVNFYPEKGKTEKMEAVLEKQLETIKSSLNRKQLYLLSEDTKKLKKFQETPSTQEELETIPLLDLCDITREVSPFKNKEAEIGGISCVTHDYHTNGIVYMNMFYDCSEVPVELVPYMTLLVEFFRYVDTEHFSYNELATELNLKVGGLSFSTGIMPLVWKKDGFRPYFGIRMKCLEEQLHDGMELVKEVLFTSKMTDFDRLKEIIGELRIKMDTKIPSSGHLFAANRALSYVDPMMRYKDIAEGMDFYDFIKELDTNFEKHKEELVRQITRVIACIFRKENLTVSLTGEYDFKKMLEEEYKTFAALLNEQPCVKSVPVIVPVKKNEGFKTAGQVQYSAIAGRFESENETFTGTLKVLKTILSYDYLWINVRVKGGAYGAMCGFSRNGYGYFTSYRDPNLKDTYEIYRKTADYIGSFDVNDRDMTKYIIGTVSAMDQPLDPVDLGERSFVAYMAGLTIEMVQKEREQVLTTTQESIRALAPYIERMVGAGAICTIGNEKKIQEDGELFTSIRLLNQ